MKPLKVTFDSSALVQVKFGKVSPDIFENKRYKNHPYVSFIVSTVKREEKFVALRVVNSIPELGTWDDSSWDDCEWADHEDTVTLGLILKQISNGSTDLRNYRDSKNRESQHRDTLIMDAHLRHEHDIFVTNDGDFDSFRSKTKVLTVEAFVKDID